VALPSELRVGSWTEDPPAAAGRACHWCELVVTAGVLARWHGEPRFLCRPCFHWRATGEGSAHLQAEGPWELARSVSPPWDTRRPLHCPVAGCPEGR
jgi:hypothetical protein